MRPRVIINCAFITSKERDNESGLDYFIARYYSSAHGRFTGVDPVNITEDRIADPQRINLYVYARNNPLLYVDPDGKDIWIFMDAKPVGTTQIRVIGSENVEGAPKTIEVPVYQVIIRDSLAPKDDSKATTYYVTRDAPVLDLNNPRNSDGTWNINNAAFEPATNKSKQGDWTDYKAVPTAYPSGANPDGTKFEAFALRETNGSAKLDAVPNPERPSKTAEGVMIHVGGQYQKQGESGTRTAASLGCFGVCQRGGGTSNSTMQGFVSDVVKRQQANRRAGTGDTVFIQIRKRQNVQWTFRVDSSGRRVN